MSSERNATRAGRTIDRLDDRKNPAANPGDRDPHGNRTPRYQDEILEDQEEAALDHVQVSGVGDVAEDGKVVGEDSPAAKAKT